MAYKSPGIWSLVVWLLIFAAVCWLLVALDPIEANGAEPALWQKGTLPTAGGSVAVLVTPGATPGSYALVMPDLAVWLLTPQGTPTPPVPPVPPIPPVPPDPVPPVPTAGLNVALIGPEPRVVRGLTPAQVPILTSRALRSYAESTCELDDDGKTPAYRVLIRSNDNSRLAPRWKSILDKAPADGCVLAAVKGSKYFLGPLPPDTAAVLKILADVSGVPADPISARDYPRLREIPAADWERYNPPSRVAIVDGEKRYLSAKPRDLAKYPRGKMPGAKPLAAFGINLIPRSEWPGRIAALKAANAGLMALTYPLTPYDQNGTNYCWCNCVAQGMTAMGYQQGRPLRYFSAASIGGPITGYRNVGGWPGDAMEFALATGAVDITLWPSNSISSRYASLAEVKADYPRNKLTAQIADLGEQAMFDEVATCVLLGSPVAVSYDWWSHAVLAVGIEQKGTVWYLILRNSWGEYEDHGFFLLPEGKGSNKGTPDDAQAILALAA